MLDCTPRAAKPKAADSTQSFCNHHSGTSLGISITMLVLLGNPFTHRIIAGSAAERARLSSADDPHADLIGPTSQLEPRTLNTQCKIHLPDSAQHPTSYQALSQMKARAKVRITVLAAGSGVSMGQNSRRRELVGTVLQGFLQGVLDRGLSMNVILGASPQQATLKLREGSVWQDWPTVGTSQHPSPKSKKNGRDRQHTSYRVMVESLSDPTSPKTPDFLCLAGLGVMQELQYQKYILLTIAWFLPAPHSCNQIS